MQSFKDYLAEGKTEELDEAVISTKKLASAGEKLVTNLEKYYDLVDIYDDQASTEGNKPQISVKSQKDLKKAVQMIYDFVSNTRKTIK